LQFLEIYLKLIDVAKRRMVALRKQNVSNILCGLGVPKLQIPPKFKTPQKCGVLCFSDSDEIIQGAGFAPSSHPAHFPLELPEINLVAVKHRVPAAGHGGDGGGFLDFFKSPAFRKGLANVGTGARSCAFTA
jgi:hypothetical protein